jgi:hypothetical protein
VEIKEGILLMPNGNPIAEARGFLKNKRFTNGPFDESTGFGEVFKFKIEMMSPSFLR